MTQNEYIVLAVAVSAVIIICTAIGHSWSSEKGAIGLRLIFLEILCAAAVIYSLYYFEMPTESVLKTRYKEKVFDKTKECFEKCIHTCTGIEKDDD